VVKVTKPHRGRTRTVQSYSPGGANVHASDTCFLGFTRVHIPDCILIGSYCRFYTMRYDCLHFSPSKFHSYSVGLLIRLSSHDFSCPLAPRKSFDILALYKSDYYYYYY